MSVNSKMTAVADEVRTLAGVSNKLSLDSMATHISDSNKEIQDQTELIGMIADALRDKVVSGGEVEVVLQNKTVTPTKATQNVVADSGYTGLGRVTVQAIPSEYIVPNGTKEITANGIHDVTDKASVSVNVPIPDGYIQPSGSVDITENGTHDVTEYASVNVNVSTGTTEIWTFTMEDGTEITKEVVVV